MHIILKEFISTDDNLSTIVEKHYDKSQYLETVFFKIVGKYNLEEVSSNLYLELDQAIIKGHADANIYLLFISVVIRFTSIRNQLERARVILSIGDSLSSKKISPILMAYFMIQKATLRHYESLSEERDELLKKAISLVDKKSPRYRSFVYLLAAIISEEGRLKELSKSDISLINSPINEKQSVHCDELKLNNFIFNGDFQNGFLVLENYQKKFKGENSESINYFFQVLNILKGDFNELNYRDALFKLYSKLCQQMVNGDLDEARNTFQTIKIGRWKVILNIPFLEYFPLHIELSLKNKGMSRLLIQEIKDKGKVHYFFDFFQARLQLIEGEREAAYESFVRFNENIKKYNAENRIIFELQFAKELKSSDMFLLMNKINNSYPTKNIKSGKVPEGKQAIASPAAQLLIGESVIINQVKVLVRKFAKLKEPILITGETGTGKELVSKALHEEGLYPLEPFLAINCGALTESLLQSELFGYVAGAFTGAQKEHIGIFESAGKGTVFLDEFGDISPKLQTSLLRVLENNEIRLIGGTTTRKIECRMVIATNINLQQAVNDKKFREDLFFRITRFDIQLPALRDRKDDIPKLIKYFLERKDSSAKIQQKISDGLLNILSSYHWPGNVRELKNEIERLKILYADKEVLEIDDFDFSRFHGNAKTSIGLSKDSFDIQVNKKAKKKANLQDLILDKEHIANILENSSKSNKRLICFKDLFLKYKKLTRSQIVKITYISPSTVTKDLKTLCDSKFIEKRMPTNSVNSHYFVLVE